LAESSLVCGVVVMRVHDILTKRADLLPINPDMDTEFYDFVKKLQARLPPKN
jgi:hypothetical protein